MNELQKAALERKDALKALKSKNDRRFKELQREIAEIIDQNTQISVDIYDLDLMRKYGDHDEKNKECQALIRQYGLCQLDEIRRNV